MEHNNTNTSSSNTSSKETKEQLVLRIKEWIKIDNEISKLKKEIKERNDKKKKLTEGLVNVMKTNEIDCFDINGGALVYKKSLVKKPINGKMLMDTLQKYFKNDSQEATELTKFILDNRQQELKETIRRKIDKTVDK
jgi:single-stranded DNA-specific DHH superfamily exonuclease